MPAALAVPPLPDTELFASDSTRQAFACTMRSKIKRHHPLEILLVEDDASDAMLAECALDDTHISYALHCIASGSEVIPYLRREGKYSGAMTPDLILLDLTLPQKDGLSVLTDLTQEASFRRIPIIVLTGSQDYKQVVQGYSLWLSDYLPKPCSGEQLQEALGKLHSPRAI